MADKLFRSASPEDEVDQPDKKRFFVDSDSDSDNDLEIVEPPPRDDTDAQAQAGPSSESKVDSWSKRYFGGASPLGRRWRLT